MAKEAILKTGDQSVILKPSAASRRGIFVCQSLEGHLYLAISLRYYIELNQVLDSLRKYTAVVLDNK